MNNISLRTRVTLWFSAALSLMAALTVFVVISVSWSVMQRTVRDELIRTVEDNVDEIEYVISLDTLDRDADADQYIRYGEGHLEIDDDFLDEVNGVYTALYSEDGELLYGEAPAEERGLAFADRQWQRLRGTHYILYDRKLEQPGLEGLWLRGSVMRHPGEAPMPQILFFSLALLPALTLIAVAAGRAIAGRVLIPVRSMSKAVAQISGGNDLKRRIPVEGDGELSRLASSFNEMMARLDTAFEAERRFASDVSHELRTPMTVILAQCDYALEADRTPEEYQQALHVVRRQGRRMSKLISDMLELLRMERRTDVYTMRDVDFSALVRMTAEDMALIRERGIALTCEVEEGIVVRGNEALLVRLLNNLIGNAYRYGRENGHIVVRLARNGAQIALSVQDDGVGIEKAEQENIFRRFYQASSSRTGEGTGLGLAMVRQIARLHGGEVTVCSEPGQGSTFTFRMMEKMSAL